MGGALIGVGSFLPWISLKTGFGSITKSGMEGGDGYITLVAGIVAGLVGVAALSSKLGSGIALLPIIAALIAGAIGLINLVDIQGRVEEFNVTAGQFGAGSLGSGLGAILVGSLLCLVAGIMLRSRVGD
ncbi:MAG: hypothetical protein ABR505_11845 [Actinomycetota bacterium]